MIYLVSLYVNDENETPTLFGPFQSADSAESWGNTVFGDNTAWWQVESVLSASGISPVSES